MRCCGGSAGKDKLRTLEVDTFRQGRVCPGHPRLGGWGWMPRDIGERSDAVLRTAMRGDDESAFSYFTRSSSTSKISVAFGGMTPPAPLEP